MTSSKNTFTGHFLAALTILFWGTAFLASKMLLGSYTPLQLMFMRFCIAYAALWIVCPKWYFRWKEEYRFLLMSLFGNMLYFFCESTALNLTQTSNVSVLVTTAPLFTALWLCGIRKKETLSRRQLFGFGLAFVGMVLTVFNGAFFLKLNPLGDLLAIGGGMTWAVYSVMLRQWGGEYSGALLTRKVMLYGILTSGPVLLLSGQSFPFATVFSTPDRWLPLLYLGILCSCVSYTIWNIANKKLGVLVSGIYINAIPLVALVASALAFHERVTAVGLLGMACVVCGVILGSLAAGKGKKA